MELDTIVCMDALAYLRQLPDASVDCVVTSPPYNMRTTIRGAKLCSPHNNNWGASALLTTGYSDFDDAMPYEDYIKWQRSILSECLRVIKDTGAIFYNHKWRIQSGVLDTKSAITDGLPVRQIIIWNVVAVIIITAPFLHLSMR